MASSIRKLRFALNKIATLTKTCQLIEIYPHCSNEYDGVNYLAMTIDA